MAQLKLPFGRGHITADIPDGRLAGVLQSRAHSYQAKADQPELVRQALENPIGSPRLRELAAGKNKVVILSSDHTRPVPSKVILPQLVEELRAGNPDAEITVLVATGFHRPTTEAELLDKYGETLYRHSGLRFVIHESGKKEDMVHLGTLPSGGELLINKLAAEADLLVGEGFIEPHFFAGFSGGRKSVLPGVSSRETVLANHCSAFIDSPNARTGILDGNPIHRDMLYAAQQAKLAFICNVVIDADKRVIAAFRRTLRPGPPGRVRLCRPALRRGCGSRSHRHHHQRGLPPGPEPVPVGEGHDGGGGHLRPRRGDHHGLRLQRRPRRPVLLRHLRP